MNASYDDLVIDTRNDDGLSVDSKCKAIASNAWFVPNFAMNVAYLNYYFHMQNLKFA